MINPNQNNLLERVKRLNSLSDVREAQDICRLLDIMNLNDPKNTEIFRLAKEKGL